MNPFRRYVGRHERQPADRAERPQPGCTPGRAHVPAVGVHDPVVRLPRLPGPHHTGAVPALRTEVTR